MRVPQYLDSVVVSLRDKPSLSTWQELLTSGQTGWRVTMGLCKP
ncbi:MAG: hypothetical protein RLZZ226_76 [Pseudomonadota bacterium]